MQLLPFLLLLLAAPPALWLLVHVVELRTETPPSFVLAPLADGNLQNARLSNTAAAAAAATLPTVLVPGMGDSCFNTGFAQLTQLVQERTQTSAFCVGPGFDPVSDAINSFAKTMTEQLEQFRAKVQSNQELKRGFNAIGLSQGNLILRAYAQRYNDPPLLNFISIHGPHAGVSSLPRCDPRSSALYGAFCVLIDTVVGGIVYSAPVQSALAQANYFRDPMRLEQYAASCTFLPEYLDGPISAEDRARFTKLVRLVLVHARHDTMIYPKESELFGAFASKSFDKIVPGNAQPWYGALGLDELERTGRLITRATTGNHLQFTKADLFAWLDEFFIQA